MKIIAHYVYYNNAQNVEHYTLETLVEEVLRDVKEFIVALESKIDYANLIEQWSKLVPIVKKHPKINLRWLIKKYGQKYTIGYGGYLRFELIYDKIQYIHQSKPVFSMNGSVFLNETLLKLVLGYLSNKELLCLSMTSKCLYQCVQRYSSMTKELRLANSTRFNANEINSIVIKPLKEGSALFGYYLGKESNYFFIQDNLLFFSIIKQAKGNPSAEEVVFRDKWTQYYLRDNKLFQIKYDKFRPEVFKLKKDDEITYAFIYFKEPIELECFYYYEDTLYLLTKDKVLREIPRGSKAKMVFDFSKKQKKFNQFRNHCKKWSYECYCTFIKEVFFISLCSFYIINIQNKRTLNYFPTVRGVEVVQEANDFFYAKNNRECFVISKRTFEIVHHIERAEMPLCFNEGLRSNNYGWNYLDERNIKESLRNERVDFIVKGNELKIKPKEVYDHVSKEYLFKDFNECFLCDYYFNNDFTFIRLYAKSTKLLTLTLQFINKQFVKHLQVQDDALRNQRIFFNSFGGVIINIGELLWIYKNASENPAEVKLAKINRIRLKANIQFAKHHLIFTQSHFLLWHLSSDSLLHYALTKENKMKLSSIGLEPLFVFHFNHTDMYLITKDCVVNQLVITSDYSPALTKLGPIHIASEKIDNIIFSTFSDAKRTYLIIFTIESILIFKESAEGYDLSTEISLIEPGEVHQLRNGQFFVYCQNDTVHYYSLDNPMILIN